MAVVEFTKEDYDVITREWMDLQTLARKRCRRDVEMEMVQKAFDFANQAHKNVRRKSGEPYILHPIAVAKIVIININLGYKSICAALLHDVVEDTDYTVEDIRHFFGDKIASLVDGLTKMKSILDTKDSDDVQSLQAENFRRILLTLNDDARVVLIKLADRLHNCRTIEFMKEHKRDKILSETMYIFIPLAHRLGLYEIKNELENIWLRFKEPIAYNEIVQRINLFQKDKEQEFDAFITPIRESLDRSGIQYRILKRIKTPYSIWKKMNAQGVEFERIYDLFAVRIVFEPRTDINDTEDEQVYYIESKVIALYAPHPSRFRDWIRQPKNNGYKAMHLTVMSPNGFWVEVQIRSHKMDDIAERGIAAHWMYKRQNETIDSANEIDAWLNRLQEVLLNPDLNTLEVMDLVHNDMISKNIVVYTPKGDSRVIDKDATALDFAFLIHTHLGHKATGARINGVLSPLSTVLSNGDQVEIITQVEPTTNPEWLNFLVTKKARNAVQDKLNLHEKINLRLQQQEHPEDTFQPSKRSSLSKIIGIFKKSTKDENSENQYDTALFETDQSPYQYILAPCCQPIPGDDIVGFLNTDKTLVTVHKKTCERSQKEASLFGDSIVIPKWKLGIHRGFPVKLTIKGIDRKGVLGDISRYVSYVMGLSFISIHVVTRDGIYSGDIELNVTDRNALNTLIQKLSKIEGMQSVKRTDL